MKLALLCWYISTVIGVLVGAAFLSMLWYGPEIPLLLVYVTMGLFGLFVFDLGFILFRLSPRQWVHRSEPVWAVLITAAVAALAVG